MYVFFNMSLCVYVWMCGCMGFVMCGCLYVWILVCVHFVMCGVITFMYECLYV